MAHFHVKPTPVKTNQTSLPRAADIIEIEDQDGPRAAYAALKQKLDPLRTSGTTVPTDLVRLEQRLITECCAMSQGR